MPAKKFTRSIGGKVLGLAALITLLVFLAIFLVSFFWQRQAAVARIASAGKDASGMLQLALDGPMLRGDADEMRGIFRKARDLNGRLTLHLTGPDGKVKFTTHPAMQDASLDAPGRPGELRRLVGASLRQKMEGSSLLVLDGKRSLLQVRTVANEPRCQACHDPGQAILGSLVTVQDVSAEWAAMNTQNSLTGLLALAGLVILVLGLGRLIQIRITRPLTGFGQLLEQVAGGDLSQQAQDRSQDELGDMGRALNHTIGTLRAAMEEIQGVASRLASGSSELAAATHELRGTTDANARNLDDLMVANQSTSASVLQLAGSVETVAAIAEATRRDSRASLQAAEQGTAAGEKSERSMDRVHEASAQMVAAVRMIQEIARQTNMLSLNAAIEAAKAGESGRGFGVVSEEVRKLAERSSAFARQINDLIHTTEAAGDEGRATMLETVQTLRDIHTQVSGLASRMDRIGGATLEQAGATTQVTDAVREIAGKTEQVAAATEQTAATVTEVSRTIADHAALAESLTQLAARFRI